MFHHFINYQHVSIDFAIIIGVALQTTHYQTVFIKY
jgi:hypothetical protein